MGSPTSFILSEIYLQYLENTNIINIVTIPGIEGYFTYVDDILIIYNKTQVDINEILILFNNLTPYLNFTLELEKDSKLNFLDISLTKTSNRISYDIYMKPTTTDTVIPNDSCHPREHNGLRTAISTHTVTRTEPSTTPSHSPIPSRGKTRTKLNPCGAPSRSSSDSTTGVKTTNSTWHITCSRRGARPKEFHCSCNSFTSSQTRTSPSAMCRPPIPRKHSSLSDLPCSTWYTCPHLLLLRYRHASAFCYYVTSITSHPPLPSLMQPRISVLSSVTGEGEGWRPYLSTVGNSIPCLDANGGHFQHVMMPSHFLHNEVSPLQISLKYH